MDFHIPPLRPRPPNQEVARAQSGQNTAGEGRMNSVTLDDTVWDLLCAASVQPPPEKSRPMSRLTSLDDRQQAHPRPPPVHSHYRVPSNENATSSKGYGYNPNAPSWSTAGIPPWSTSTRPLSDIREITEPSLVDSIRRKPTIVRRPSKASISSHRRTQSVVHRPSAKLLQPELSIADEEVRGRPAVYKKTPNTPGDRSSCSSVYSIPLANVPPRSTSKPRRQNSTARSVPASIEQPPPRGHGYTIPNHGRARSPVKEYVARFDPVTFESQRRVPSRTFIRSPHPTDVLDAPTHRHPRVSVDLHLSAPLFVGGGSIEGHVRLNVDDAERIRHKRAIALGRISVDLLGVEEMTASKRFVFLNLATELIDAQNPPPQNMVESTKQLSPIDPFWLLAPSISSMPFVVSLPLDVGPPPFQSKHARIRYMLCVTLLIRDQGRQYLVRSSQEVSVLSVYDPEKALMSLPSPLTASDEHVRHRETTTDTIRVTAGLHRQVWVSGTNIFVDMHIANHSRKSIRRVELQLERDILCYKHAAAATLEKSASQARIFDSNERVILTKAIYKQGQANWGGVPPHASEVRTYDLELPRGHATVKCGKYFEVRYFLNITVGSSHTKLVTVQLPIVLIHINSLDVVPNSVAQVAAAIEEKRATTAQTSLHTSATRSPRVTASPRATANMHLARNPSVSVQGRAFAAPRMQSMERIRAESDDLAQLGHILDASPRRYAAPIPLPTQGPQHHIRRMASSFEYHTPPSNRKGRVLLEDERDEIHRRLRHVASVESNRTALSVNGKQNRLPGRVHLKTSKRQMLRGGAQSTSGFRQAEMDDEVAVVLDMKPISNFGSIRGRAERNFQFPAVGRSKSQSKERWKGFGWLRGGKGDDNWI